MALYVDYNALSIGPFVGLPIAGCPRPITLPFGNHPGHDADQLAGFLLSPSPGSWPIELSSCLLGDNSLGNMINEWGPI